MTFTEFQPWIYTILFGLMSVLIIGNNIWHLIISRIHGESTSFTLMVGAVLGSIAFLAAPESYLKWYALLPIIVDPGAGFSIFVVIKEKYGSARK
jgi:hypothetical protein